MCASQSCIVEVPEKNGIFVEKKVPSSAGFFTGK
jgi:hypothetical protein